MGYLPRRLGVRECARLGAWLGMPVFVLVFPVCCVLFVASVSLAFGGLGFLKFLPPKRMKGQFQFAEQTWNRIQVIDPEMMRAGSNAAA